jgi:hypothetical protein
MNERDLHVLPIDDLRDHEESRDCWCAPTVSQEPDADPVVVHHAADGRELVEAHGLQ